VEVTKGFGSVFCLATYDSTYSKFATTSFPGMGLGGYFSSSELDEYSLTNVLLAGNF
jgi:hypothetical protein